MKIQPILAESSVEKGELHEVGSESTGSADLLNGKKTISIKFSLILLLLGLVIACVLFLTIVWASSFSGSVVTMSQKLLESNFGQIIDFVDNSMKKIAMSAETTRNAVLNEFDYTRSQWIFDTTFMVYQSQEKFVNGLTINAYFGNNIGLGGYIGVTTSVARQLNLPLLYRYKMLGNDTNGLFKRCDYYKSDTTCINDGAAEYDYDYGPFDMSYVVNYANKAKNTTIFSTSYVHSSFPLWVWFTCVSAHTKTGASNFDWYFAIDITAHSLSVFLSDFTSKIANSMAIVIEIESDYLIANNFADIPPTIFYKNGTSHRKTVFTFENDNVKTVGKAVYSQLGNNLKSMQCSTFMYSSVGEYYVGVYRLCTATGLNWMIIFAVPQWNYINSIVIAVIVASVVSVIITLCATFISLGFSSRIVKPFKQLLNQFEFISEMQLDVAETMKISSKLTEIEEFQEHISTMIRKMKQYRAFIPQHLLAKLDNNESMTERTSMSSKFSSKKMDSDHAHSSSVHNAKNKFLFKLGVEQRQVVSAMIYFEGLEEVSTNLKETELVNLFTNIFGVIQKFANPSNAMIGTLEKSSIILSWNSCTTVQKPEEKALTTLSQILPALKQVDKNIKPCIAVVSQMCKAGNIGTNAVKTFTIIGSYQHNLENVINIMKQMKVELAITKAVHEKGVDPLFHTRTITWSNLLLDNYNQSLTKIPIYEVGSSKQVAMDEWMYELEQKESGDKWKAYNQGIQSLEQGFATQAKNLFEEFQSNWLGKHGRRDVPTDHMINLCAHSEEEI